MSWNPAQAEELIKKVLKARKSESYAWKRAYDADKEYFRLRDQLTKEIENQRSHLEKKEDFFKLFDRILEYVKSDCVVCMQPLEGRKYCILHICKHILCFDCANHEKIRDKISKVIKCPMCRQEQTAMREYN
jgi:hypothetical protein